MTTTAMDIEQKELPAGWKWVKLGDVAIKLVDGTHHSPENSEEGNFMYVTSKNIRDFGLDLDDISYVDEEVHKEIYKRCNPEKGDILYVKDGVNTGTVAMNTLDEEFSMLSSVALIKLPESISNDFMLWVLKSPRFIQGIREQMDGNAITRVTLKKLKACLIPLPPIEEQKRIAAILNEQNASASLAQESIQQELDTIEAMPASLLRKAFSGEL